MVTIIFDERSAKWYKHPDLNETFLVKQSDNLIDECEYRGYVYLNRVYEAFGIEWNPDDENICYRRDNGGIELEIVPIDNNSYKVHVRHYTKGEDA